MDRDAIIADLQRRVEAIEQKGRRPRGVAAMDGDTLARLRRAASLSQRDLAGYLGLSGAAVHAMERGGIPIDAKRAAKVRRIVARIIRRIDDHSRSQEQAQALSECEG